MVNVERERERDGSFLPQHQGNINQQTEVLMIKSIVNSKTNTSL